MDSKQIDIEVAGYEERLRVHRRALHRIPEVGYEEHRTHAYLMEHLKALAPDDLRAFAGTGIRAVFRGNGTGRVLAFRSDIDALPVTEETGCSFASTREGFMHACGHDGHMANLLTFAEWLNAHRDMLADDVVLIFQPAEETTGGAKRMIDEGALENPHVDVIYGMHMMPDVPKGKIAACAGPIMAQTCEMDFIIHGRSAHGATPHLGRDAITAMGHLITLLQTTVARSVDPGQPALITIGRVEGGRQRNILADRVQMEGIVRTFSNEVYEGLESRIRDDLRGVEAAFDVDIEFVKRVYYPCVENDPAEFERVKALLGDRFVQAVPRTTAEDFSYYQLSVPGVFVFCGCMDEAHSSPLHASTFDFDEAALLPGLALFAGLVTYTG
ncbi:MAG: M20 family metallopeptidase [Clostridia bacterium]|nr:M20 family metallopeptidase [Clostridia bacterium]